MDGVAPGAVEQVVSLLLGLGLPGVIIIVLCVAVYKLYNRNEELNETLRNMGMETVRAQEATTAALNRLSDMLIRVKAPE